MTNRTFLFLQLKSIHGMILFVGFATAIIVAITSGAQAAHIGLQAVEHALKYEQVTCYFEDPVSNFDADPTTPATSVAYLTATENITIDLPREGQLDVLINGTPATLEADGSGNCIVTFP